MEAKNKVKGKRRRKVMIILGWILGVIVVLNVIGFLVNTIFFKDELKAMEPYGQMVEVKDSKMHVYSMGQGEETIVLLPGLGVSLPSADFGPLMRKLSENYKVVTVEYFGVGFSGQSKTERTNENYVEEIREALDKAGIKPPYILMPHSASGIYSEYYAAKYPEEISSMIMLDTTSTAITEGPNVPAFLYSIAKLQQATGFTRLTLGLVPDTKLEENGYTKKEKADYKMFNYHVINDTFIDQSIRLMENAKEVNKIDFPSSVPVMKIISKQSIDRLSKKDKEAGMKYQNDHMKRLGENVSYKIVDATHFVYHTKADEIVDITKDFLAEVKGTN